MRRSATSSSTGATDPTCSTFRCGAPATAASSPPSPRSAGAVRVAIVPVDIVAQMTQAPAVEEDTPFRRYGLGFGCTRRPTPCSSRDATAASRSAASTTRPGPHTHRHLHHRRRGLGPHPAACDPPRHPPGPGPSSSAAGSPAWREFDGVGALCLVAGSRWWRVVPQSSLMGGSGVASGVRARCQPVASTPRAVRIRCWSGSRRVMTSMCARRR